MYSSAFAFAGFFAAAAALFAFNMDAAEGGFSTVASIWALSVSPVLPFLASLLGMDVWSEEKRSGRIEILLSSPVLERDLAIGKFLGVWTMCLAATGVFLAASTVFLASSAPSLLDDATAGSFAAAFAILALQSALWSAAATAASALFKTGAAAAVASCAALGVAPRAIWLALRAWSPRGASAFGSMPLDDHAYDFASGLFSVGTTLSYAVLTFAALFTASKLVAGLRCRDCASRTLRASTRFSTVLAAVFAALAVSLAARFDFTLDLPCGGSGRTKFSDRTRSVLREARGSLSATLFLSRKDPRFRDASHFLRALKRESAEVGGIAIAVFYVDPVVDIAEARRLVREGVEEGCCVFERNGRIVDSIAISGGSGERAVTSLIERIALPSRKSAVYWTTGHGEASYSDYGPGGMSDFARDLALDGYACKNVNLAAGEPISDDCALVIVAGPRGDFAEAEAERLKAYVEGLGAGGGRLLVLIDSPGPGTLQMALASLGVRTSKTPAGTKTRTLNGSDVIADGFSTVHPVSRPLAGRQVVLDRPIAVSRSFAAGDAGSAADITRFTPILEASGVCFAAAAERGAVESEIPPSRVVAVGDAGFATNGRLGTYANANRDFLLNAVRYLSGRETASGSGADAGRLASGMDRSAKASFAVKFAVVFPAAAFAVLSLGVFARRRRK